MKFVAHRNHMYEPPRPVTGIALLVYTYMKFVTHRKHMYKPPRPVTGIALLVYTYMMFVPHRKHMYKPPPPVTGIALLLYMNMMFVPHRKHMYKPPRPVTGVESLLLLHSTSYRLQLCGSVSSLDLVHILTRLLLHTWAGVSQPVTVWLCATGLVHVSGRDRNCVR
jgi:hypothetical protein